MASRLEYKYLVPRSQVDAIRAEIQPYVAIDQYADKQDANEYTVRSIYYDNSRLDCYSEKIEGLKVRKKFRIRGYNTADANSIVFLEIKRKYINFIEKNRAPLPWRQLDELLLYRDLNKHIMLLSGNGKEKIDAQRFLYHYYSESLRPVALIVYEREAFFGKFNSSLRITFDKNLRSSLFPSQDMLFEKKQTKYAMPKYFILEVKFYTGIPAWMRSIIRRYQLPRMALSKYTICIDSHKSPRKFGRGRNLGLTDNTNTVRWKPARALDHV